MQNHQLINQTSGLTEWYTPKPIIEAARLTLGVIQYDPFSCAKANEVVKAETYSTYQDDGFSTDWSGKKIWCNHPFNRVNNKLIAEKAINAYHNDAEIVMITFAATSESWFKPLLQFPQCFLYGRTNYIDQNGKKVSGVTKGSCVTYLGKNVEFFYQAFKDMGEVKISY